MEWCSSGPIAGSPASPAHARDFCTARLTSMFGPAGADLVDDAELIVSELVTNAVNAASTSAEVVLMSHEGQVRIAVHDDAPGRPAAGTPTAHANHGRGLLIVARLATDWGVEYSHAGKSVWAELAVPG